MNISRKIVGAGKRVNDIDVEIDVQRRRQHKGPSFTQKEPSLGSKGCYNEKLTSCSFYFRCMYCLLSPHIICHNFWPLKQCSSKIVLRRNMAPIFFQKKKRLYELPVKYFNTKTLPCDLILWDSSFLLFLMHHDLWTTSCLACPFLTMVWFRIMYSWALF